MTLNCTLRDNVFVYDGDMDLSFARSAGFRVTGNIFHLNGKLKVNDPDAITEWSGNQIVQSGDVRPAIAHDLPAVARSLRQTPRSPRDAHGQAARDRRQAGRRRMAVGRSGFE